MKDKFLLSIGLMFMFPFVILGSVSANYESILSDPDLSAYHGFLKYLHFRANQIPVDDSIQLNQEKWDIQFDNWLQRIHSDPDVIRSMRGTFEWAYESNADQSGQPFKIAVPLNYDPSKSYPLSVYIHGYSGNHMEHSEGMESHLNYFQVAVLGRARGGYYQNLSEIDVLDVIRYVQENWKIDPQRIHLNGGSMGGWGTFYLSNRYPQMVASASPTCGYAGNLPVGNWNHVPFYSIHSVDDYVVPVVMSRIPLQQLMNVGGSVILDETDGYGHASWDYVEGQDRAKAWFEQYQSPLSTDVKHIDYTAYDGKARRGYWAEIVEWGSQHDPARFILNLENENFLNVKLKNIHCLEINVSESPINRSKDLQISMTGQSPVTIPHPIPESFYLINNEDGLSVAFQKQEHQIGRLRFPGGARNLYSGEPLLIVWGTLGTEDENKTMLNAALSARRSPNPKWVIDEGRGTSEVDGLPHIYNTYGLLAGKSDVDVTEYDLQNHHLVIIGNARQNLIARRLCQQFPISVENNRVLADDGVNWDMGEPAVVFNFQNPLSRNFLVSWVACDDVSFYSPGNTLVEFASEPFGGMDLAVFDYKEKHLVSVRNFNSRWEWESGYEESPKLLEIFDGPITLQQLEANMACEAVNAQCYLFHSKPFYNNDWLDWSEIRLSDMRPYYYGRRYVTADFSGKLIEKLQNNFSCPDSELGEYEIMNRSSCDEPIDQNRYHRIVTDLYSLKNLMEIIQEDHLNMQYSNVSQTEAFDRYVRSHYDCE